MDIQKENYSKIYDNCVDKIYRFIFFKVNSQDIAEDLCSETFLRGWEVLKNKENAIDNPQAFLYKVARNLIADHYREKGKAQVILADNELLIDPRSDFQEGVISNLEFDRAKVVLSKLKDDYQEVVIWHFIEELSVPEIAKILDKSEGAVRVMLHRSIKAIKKGFEQA
jgi:RNA polymerase sigma-70 factor, ECF subfamily